MSYVLLVLTISAKFRYLPTCSFSAIVTLNDSIKFHGLLTYIGADPMKRSFDA